MGLSLRGNWANEGKVLVLMDGQPFNELLYQSVAVGNRFPVDAIERVEIIRGPGSAQYGGSAEYGVINIITKVTINGQRITDSDDSLLRHLLYGNILLFLSDNQADTGIISKVCPYPIDENNKSVSKTDKGHEMDKHPDKPCPEALRFICGAK